MDRYNKKFLRNIKDGNGLTALTNDEQNRFLTVIQTYQQRQRFNGILFFGLLQLLITFFTMFFVGSVYDLAVICVFFIVNGTIWLMFILVTPMSQERFDLRLENEKELINKLENGNLRV